MPISQITKVGSVESPPQPEKKQSKIEKTSTLSPEVPPVEFGSDRSDQKVTATPPLPTPVNQPSIEGNSAVDSRFKKIESILEEDLADVYFNLSPQKKHEFKVRGEETAIKISDLIIKPKLQLKKIISLIRDWLKVIPGINIFFLEQMVKIKADKIVNETSKKN